MNVRPAALMLFVSLAILAVPPVANAGPESDDNPTVSERQFLDRVGELGYTAFDNGWRETVEKGASVCEVVGQPGQFSTSERWMLGRNSVLLMYSHSGPTTNGEMDRADAFAGAAVGWLCPSDVVALML